ncbi:hypothetical protein Pla100_53310 [Neorhodopirellula pilleata]|uniref:Uncharacterized protein n=1 Tax=Neorhodopirellula pilleata TaxID=2714738 RepID=A0A5C5ZWE5_9BACT|nr:hypothetical protein Pla100_53310 [Neorhodopirellula pilleata]
MDLFISAVSTTEYFWDSWYELKQYATELTPNHWAVFAASSVVFGFFCLQGNPLKR